MLYFLHSSNITCLVCNFTICCCSIYIYRVHACIINIHVYYDVHQRCSRKYEKQNKPLFLQILRPHQWKVIVHAPCSLQGAAFIQNIFLFYICTWEKISPLRMKDLAFDINRNKFDILWLTILNLYTRNLCLQFQEICLSWCNQAPFYTWLLITLIF